MALTLEYTQADVDALKAAIVSGVLTVTYSGPPARTITYQSSQAMRDLLAEILATDRAADGKKPYRLAAHRKGF